jgi:glycosyltransferase involved in cell wall biosynthesis
MSIRFITRKWPPAVGGMETYAVQLVAALRAHEKVELIALPGRNGGLPPSVPRLLWFGATTAMRLLVSAPAQVTHIGDMASWPLALAARLRSGSTRLALSAHGTDVSFPLRRGLTARLYGQYLALGARLLSSAVVIANSQATAEAARQRGFRRVAVVTPGTDVHADAPVEACGAHLLFVGRLTPLKGCAWFIRNVMPLLPAGMGLRVIGAVWDEQERAALDADRVTFVGPVRGDALIREYASAICVVLPNIDVPTRQFEGFGLTAVEAAAAGGVVLASRHGGLAEAVIDGVTGFHLPPGDAPAWASRILEVARWPVQRRAGFIEGAMAAARRRFSWERVAHETRAAYSQASELLRPSRAAETRGRSLS